MPTVTDGGEGRLSTIYERLRKRSLRALNFQGCPMDWEAIALHEHRQDRALHRAYVTGVRDALNAVRVDS